MRKEPTQKAWIQTGPIVRSRTTQRQYDSYRRTVKINEDCVFCNPEEMLDRHTHGEFTIIGNRFKYEIWDGCKVLDHLMIIPNRHVGSLNELTPEEKLAYVDLLGSYEAEGYSIYSRSINSATRTVIHLHTHLIKLDTTPIKGLVYLKKPHVLLYRK